MILTFILIFVAVLIFLVLTIGGFVIGLYNSFINGQQNIKNQWSNILTEYQRRADLFYNLTQTVKSYAKFEKETMTAVIQARANNFGTNFKEQLENVGKLDDAFSSILSKLAVVVEKYPNLKAIHEYDRLMREVRITEDRINVARTDYNAIVRDFNVMVKSFPNNIFANMFGFKETDFYVNEKASESDYKIKFD